MTTEISSPSRQRIPWNKGRLIGQKRPLKPKDVWTIRARLQLEGRRRDLAMFNVAIDSKLRGCDLVCLGIDDVVVGGRVRDRATVIQRKTGRPVQFEITEQTRRAIGEWVADLGIGRGPYGHAREERDHAQRAATRGSHYDERLRSTTAAFHYWTPPITLQFSRRQFIQQNELLRGRRDVGQS
jgi:hypothetical protein